MWYVSGVCEHHQMNLLSTSSINGNAGDLYAMRLSLVSINAPV